MHLHTPKRIPANHRTDSSRVEDRPWASNRPLRRCAARFDASGRKQSRKQAHRPTSEI